MATPTPSRRVYEFGRFRLDALSRVLFREGQPMPLGPTAVETLLVLVENRGSIVAKEELLRAVWPDTVVEESNLTHNVSVLRKTLGEGPGEQRFIQTFPKRGYRFVAPVSEIQADEQPDSDDAVRAKLAVLPQPPLRPATLRLSATFRGRSAALLVLGIFLLFAFVTGLKQEWFSPSIRQGVPESSQKELTANPIDDPVFRAAISPDGKYLAYTDLSGIHLLLINEGENRLLSPPGDFCSR
jgi:DNA-binding winged helix-turn-helix (wHTH) protein